MSKMYIFLLIAIIGCQKPKENVSIFIENSHINFIDKSGTSIYNYKNDDERKNSSNILSVKITNESNKKYLLIIDENVIFPELSLYQDTRNLNFLISNKDNSYITFYHPITDFNKALSGIYEIERYNDSLAKKKYEKLGVSRKNFRQVLNYENNSIIIYPGETRTLKYIINLPIIREMSWKRDYSVIAYESLQEGQKFKVAYSCNATNLKKVLPEYILNELKENNIEIFDGIIQSNEIPLKSL